MTTALLGLMLSLPQPPSTATQPPIRMVVRVFDGTEEVSADARVQVYQAGSRESPLSARLQAGVGLVATVAPGMYDVQVLRQRDGRVLNIRWAERLLVIRYPDEPAEHLQVINLKPGFGALQIRPPEPAGGAWPADIRVSVFASGDRTNEAAKGLVGPDYLLFVLPAGKYDLLIRRAADSTWMTDVEVPLDRTRLRQLSDSLDKRPVGP